MEIASNGKTINSVRVSDLSTYLQVLIENYQVKGKGKPSDLTSLQKVFYDVEHMNNGIVSDNDNKVRQRLDNIIKLMGTTSIENKNLKELQNVSKKDYSNSTKDAQKRYRQAILDFEKNVRKVKNKYPELNKSSFSVMENNLARVEAKKMSPFYNDKGDFCVIYRGREQAPKSWKSNVEDYIASLKNEMSKIQGFSSEVEVNKAKRDEERLKVIEDYGTMVREGKIEAIDRPEKVNFFANIRYNPMKKSASVKEIVNKLSDIDYALDLMDRAISEVSNTTSINYKETLVKLQEMKKKYSSVKLQTEEQLKNSGYYDMEKKVSEQRKKEIEKEEEKLKREKVRLLYTKMITTEDREEIKRIINEIRSVDLSENVKEEEKNNAALEYKQKQEERKIDAKVVNDEKDLLHDVRAQSANNLRQEAIDNLKSSGEQYVENGSDIRTTGGNDEQRINREMAEIQSRGALTVEQQALVDLKAEGYLREDATLNDLKPYERDALNAQIRINKAAENNERRGARR